MLKRTMPSLQGWLAIFLFSGSIAAQENNPLQRARLFIAEANYSAAIPLLQEVIERDSLSLPGHYYMGLCYLTTGNLQEAVASLHHAIKIDSTSMNSLTALGRSYEQLGLLRQAEQYYLAAMKYDSSGTAITPTTARFYIDTKNWSKALPLYEQLSKSDSANAGYLIQSAKCFTGMLEVNNAVPLYERVLQMSPLNAAVALELSAIYINSNMLLSASRIIERILPQLPSHPQLWRRAGDIAFKQQSYDRAVTAYVTSMNFGDSSATSFRNLGICRYYQDNDSLALVLFNEAILRDSTDANSWFYRGVIHRRLQSYKESFNDLRVANELLIPGLLSDTYMQMGMTLEGTKKFSEAIEYYREALFTDSTKAIVWYQLALIHDQHLKNMDGAENYYNEYLRRTEGETSKYRTFAEKRLREFKEKRHFQKK